MGWDGMGRDGLGEGEGGGEESTRINLESVQPRDAKGEGRVLTRELRAACSFQKVDDPHFRTPRGRRRSHPHFPRLSLRAARTSSPWLGDNFQSSSARQLARKTNQ
jgi:hypothetical protein